MRQKDVVQIIGFRWITPTMSLPHNIENPIIFFKVRYVRRPRVVKSKAIKVDNIQVEVFWKKIKNINLRIKSPAGNVVVSAPVGVSDYTIIELIRAKYQWICEKQSLLQREVAENKTKKNTDTEIFFKGCKYPVEVRYNAGKDSLNFHADGKIIVQSKNVLSVSELENLVNGWYRYQLKLKIPELLKSWLPVIGVELNEWRIRRMKTRWGSCNIVKRRIWLNLELAKLPPECLEYVVVHELVHLHERKHNARFWGLVEAFLPDWRESRRKLREWEVAM